MIRANVRARFAACMACLATAGIATACHHAAPSMTAGSPPSMPQQQISAPATKQSAADPIAALVGRTDTTAEEHVSIDTHGREADVRDILTFLGQRAHVHFVFSPEINKKVRVTLDDVPVSQAILSVFSLAGLTLEGTGT